MTRFIAVDRDTRFLFPPSVQEWLPEDHLARFIVDIVSWWLERRYIALD